MERLDTHWITDAPHDPEYKRYLLLAYVQHCRQWFREQRLYPPLAELIDHYRRIDLFSRSVEDMKKQLPRELTGIDPVKQELLYETMAGGEDPLGAIHETVEFALPTLKRTIEEGREIYEFVEQHVEVSPVGIEPIYRDEGYLLVGRDHSTEVRIYRYRHSFVQPDDPSLRALEMHFVAEEQASIIRSPEGIKARLIRLFPDFPNPATYLGWSKLAVPLAESVLPVTRRLLMRRLAA